METVAGAAHFLRNSNHCGRNCTECSAFSLVCTIIARAVLAPVTLRSMTNKNMVYFVRFAMNRELAGRAYVLVGVSLVLAGQLRLTF